MRILLAIPTYNEEKYVLRVLRRVRQYAEHVLVIDDGSTDGTPCLLPNEPVEVIRHAKNRGYGRSIQDAFRWGCVDDFDWVITMDCDEQHEPEAIPAFMDAIREGKWDVISGSRYMKDYGDNDSPPAARRAINQTITKEINERLGLSITDAFCGFKAYRTCPVAKLPWDEYGYAFPMQFWVQAVANRLRIKEIPIRLIYNDPTRTFGGPLDQDDVRLAHYRAVLEREVERCADRLPPTVVVKKQSVCAGCK